MLIPVKFFIIKYGRQALSCQYHQGTDRLLLIENANLDDTITFSQDCWNGLNYYNDMNIGILDGEQLTVNDALHAILMSSANEVCNGAAKFVSGSVSAFCDLMNERAKALGCTNTHFCQSQRSS